MRNEVVMRVCKEHCIGEVKDVLLVAGLVTAGVGCIVCGVLWSLHVAEK